MAHNPFLQTQPRTDLAHPLLVLSVTTGTSSYTRRCESRSWILALRENDRRPMVQALRPTDPHSQLIAQLLPCLTSSLRPWSPHSSPGHPLPHSPPARSGAPTSLPISTSSMLASTSVQVSTRSARCTPRLTLQCVALHLLNDDFDACHSLAQTQEGNPYADHLHCIAHRREPDYWNSK